MNALNAVLSQITRAVLAPFAGLPSQVALIVISVVAGVLAAMAFRYTSNQKALKRVADEVRASLLAMRLFRDDLRNVFAAQLGLLKASMSRLWYSLPPLVVLIVPFVFLLAQLAMWYEFRPLGAGESAVVDVRIAPDAWERYAQLELMPVDGVEFVGPVRSATGGEDGERICTISWDARPQRPPAGDQPLALRWKLDGTVVAEKLLTISAAPDSSKLMFVNPLMAGTSFWDRLLYPGEPAFGRASPIQEIKIWYGSRTNTLCGMAIPWWLTFFVVSVLGALALKPWIKVQF